MSTDSTDSSYSPSLTNSFNDDFSADASDDLSVIYTDQQLPAQPLHPAPFDLMDFEVSLSQTAFLHYQQIDDLVTSQLPQRYDEFQTLLSHAVRKNKDPAFLETTVKSWSTHQP
jgi:hypothetical protein